jgi:hypothetical protein
MSRASRFAPVLVAAAFAGTASAETKEATVPALPTAIARFAPTDIRADVSRLSAGDKQALGELVEAAKLMDAIFLRQSWSGNVAMRTALAKDATPEGKQRLHYFDINFGPWSELDRRAAFVPGAPAAKPLVPTSIRKT